MVRRWIIRSLTLTLVLCFLTAWVASYWVIAILVHYRPMGGGGTGQIGFLAIRTGQISFLSEGPLLSADWQAGLTSNMDTHWWLPEFLDHYSATSEYRVLGLYFHNSKDQFVSIPLWLPTLLLTGLNWFVWRKTRAKMAGNAFPIEPTIKSGEPKS